MTSCQVIKLILGRGTRETDKRITLMITALKKERCIPWLVHSVSRLRETAQEPTTSAGRHFWCSTITILVIFESCSFSLCCLQSLVPLHPLRLELISAAKKWIGWRFLQAHDKPFSPSSHIYSSRKISQGPDALASRFQFTIEPCALQSTCQQVFCS